MLRKCRNGLEWLEFELFQEFPNLSHAIFTRHGGNSEPPYDSLNLAFGIGDRDIDVEHNLEKVQDLIEVDRIAYAKQVHGAKLVEVKNGATYPDCDGFYTAKRHIGLMVKHADCQPAIFYDPIHQVVAAVHCGWRGSTQNIYSHTVEVLQERYRSRPEELLVGIGPSLGPEASEFHNYRSELPLEFLEFEISQDYFDFWEISRWQLREAGVVESHVEVAEICTYANPGDWYSYRRDGQTGRHGCIVALG